MMRKMLFLPVALMLIPMPSAVEAAGDQRLSPTPVYSTTEVHPTVFETGPNPEVLFTGDKMFFFGGLREVARAFRKETGIDVGLYGFGCKLGGENLIAGRSTVAGQCRAQSAPPEKKATLMRVPVARYALEVFVHPTNPVNDLSMDQLERINRAEITNWKEVGGRDAPILVVEATHCYCKHPDRGEAQHGPELLRSPRGEFTPNRIKSYSQKVLVDLVTLLPNAVAAEKSPYVEPERRRVKILKVGGIAPSREKIRSGDYPVTREMDLLVRPDVDETTMRFVDFVAGPKGQALLEKTLLVPYN